MSCCRIVSAALTLAAVIALVSVADAQQRDRGPGGGDRGRGGFGGGGGFGGFGGGFGGGGQGMDSFTLLRAEGVQKALELGDDQTKALADLRDHMQREMEDAQRRIRDQYQAKLDEVLLPHQAERVQQISLQLRGPDALLDPKVAKELGLSRDQLSKLEGIREENDRRRRDQFAGGGGGGPGGPGGGGGEDFRERFRQQREQQEQAMLAVLTAEQQAKFKEMKGDEFDRAQLGFGGGPGGGPGGPGGPGGGRGGFRGRPGN